MERVTLRHPETGETWDCPARAVPAWQEKGWQKAGPDDKSDKPSTPARRRGETTTGESNG